MADLLAVIRSALRMDAAPLSLDADDPIEGNAGANAPGATESREGAADKEDGMSQETKPVAAPAATISQGEHDAGVAAAETRGREASEQRFAAALGAENVRGDAGRMGAALDLLRSSPAMAGAAVADFVVKNVAASKVDPAAAYEAERVAAAGQAKPVAAGGPAAAAPKSTADIMRKTLGQETK